jgi:Protein of unknown function (DUF992)
MRAFILGILLSSVGLAAQAQPQSSPSVNIGTLHCHEAGGWGYILGSKHAVRCVFFTGGGHFERYAGSISKFGVDIGYQKSAVIIWEVIAPVSHPAPGMLAGHYGGVTAGAAVGYGIGANALIGGSMNSIALQPLSVAGSTGLNIAAGIGELTLRPGGGRR